MPKTYNVPAKSGIRVPVDVMEKFVCELFLAAGTSQDHAQHMGVTLTANDLRCVFSHGTRQVGAYVPQMLHGHTNPRPQVTVIEDAPALAILDGDGGLGYFPAHKATEMAIEKALALGVAAVTTRNHFHFGAAGNYSRMAIAKDCVGIVTSSHRYRPKAGASVMTASGVSPLSIAVPTENEPPFVLDMASHFLPREDDLMAQFPAAFFKSLGVAAAMHALGGMLTGIWESGFQYSGEGDGAAPHQGAVIRKEMDRYIDDAHQTNPLPGFDRAELAGGMEVIWEREQREKGIGVDDHHRGVLEKIAEQVKVDAPFAAYEGSRF
jgi:L-2-hydroxycarboxylate dehydrogenase (NAD+)